MKGAVAAMTAAYANLAARTDEWSGTLTFTAVADECVFGPNGTEYLLESFPDMLGDAVLCGEGPGGMRMAVAEKGVLWLELTTQAAPGHSTLAGPGASAISRLAAAVGELDRWAEDFELTPPAELVMLDGQPGLDLTVNVGVIQGGRLISQIPTEARAEVDLRLPPGLTVDQVEEGVREVVEPLGVKLHRIRGWDSSFTHPNTDIGRAVSEAFTDVRGSHVRCAVRLPASDASRWRRLGVPAICFGPQPTAVSGVDDYALEQDVVDSAAVYIGAALRFLGSGR
jgi:succinyl-diaminopimelate desuccinylase